MVIFLLCRGFITAASIVVVRWKSEVWVSAVLGTQKHKGDTMLGTRCPPAWTPLGGEVHCSSRRHRPSSQS
jgi:hypothetical protein